ncbi:MAG: DegT/DnrJ/EryC1/StrS family aminotransferase, partial [Candidatus Riflemargulisbacteria bacterium]
MRKGVELGNRTILGVNMRMNELTGAFALAQLRKLERILTTLRSKKALFKEALQSLGIRKMAFRRINDPDECATLLTVQFESEATAQQVSQVLASKAVYY